MYSFIRHAAVNVQNTGLQETAASQMSPAPTGMQELPCGCEMLAVVAMELLKVGMCSKCGHRFPPSLAAAESHLSERTLTSSARDFDGSNGLDTAHENGLHTTMVRFLSVMNVCFHFWMF